MKKCILSISHYKRLGDVIRDILLCDSSIHNALFRIICTPTQALEVSCVLYLLVLPGHKKLDFSSPNWCESIFLQNIYVSRLFELMEIEGLQLAMGSVLDILFIMLSNFSKVSLINTFDWRAKLEIFLK